MRAAPGVAEDLEALIYDPQTSGGILAAIPPECVEKFLAEAARHGATAWRIGLFTETGLIELAAE